MATTIDAAKPDAGQNNGNDCITAEIGKVYLSLVKQDGKCSIVFHGDWVDGELIALLDYANDIHGITLEPEGMILDGYCGRTETEVEPKKFEAIRNWCGNAWNFTRDVAKAEFDDPEIVD